MHKLSSILLLCLISIISFQSTGANTIKERAEIKFDTFDVSVLYPLPEVNHWNDLLSPTTATNLLPFEYFENITFLMNRPNDLTYPLLRVVGVRIDPCFMEGRGPLRCECQIRFIWQPLAKTDVETTTADATLHVFFRLDDSEFDMLVKKLSDLKGRYFHDYPDHGLTALSIHPLLKKYGLRSAYARELNGIFLDTIKDKEMKRITFMKLKGVNDIWVFGGFNIKHGAFTQMQIPRIDEAAIQQDFINSMAMNNNPTKFMGGIFPSSDPNQLFNIIAKDSFEIDSTREIEIRDMVREIADFEHPQRHNPTTLDCVTCHLANTMRSWSNINFRELNLQEDYDQNKYLNSNFNLTNASEKQGQTNIVRMFGYFDEKPFIAQRTINESAEVARFLNSKGH